MSTALRAGPSDARVANHRPLWRAAAARLSVRGALVVTASCIACGLLVAGSWSQAPVARDIPLLNYVLVYGLCGSALYLAVMTADEAIERGAERLVAYAAALVCGAGLGAGIDYLVRDVWFAPWQQVIGHSGDESLPHRVAWRNFFIFVVYGGLATFIYVTLRSARQATTQRNAGELARQQARRRMIEARLLAMQACIEPQFLFNTLGQIRSLYEQDSRRGGVMLEHLIAYLRAALPQLRDTASTLGQEAALVRAYLEIVRMRLGDRLSFTIAIPTDAAAARVPPMMLLPLVEHALARTDSDAGASIVLRLDAECGDGTLRCIVTDSGSAFASEVAADRLARIDERLRALYANDARLRWERTAVRGSRAVLEIPCEQADCGDR